MRSNEDVQGDGYSTEVAGVVVIEQTEVDPKNRTWPTRCGGGPYVLRAVNPMHKCFAHCPMTLITIPVLV
jgi:hypothetical protein